MSASVWLTNRDIASGFIQSVASRLGFPQRTIATAQQIYQRFHLFYPPSDFVLHEIAVASLFVAAKLNDTHKKPRDLLLASYALRFPQLIKGGGDATPAGPSNPAQASAADEPNFPTLAGQKRKLTAVPAPSDPQTSSPRPLAMAIGSVGETDIDPNILETDRKRLMALEKLILESLCFNFHSNANITLKMVIKLGRRSKTSKSLIRTAWKVAADMFRTSAPMQYAPSVIAVAALYAAALLARPPARTGVPSEQKEGAAGADEDGDDDAVVTFLNNIKAVSTTPAPQSTEYTAPATTVPLAEPFPGCDPDTHAHIEDVEEAVHDLLDLYLSCASQLPPSLYMTTSGHGHGTATPSPLSPADPHDFTTSPSSSAGLSDASNPTAGARKKLKQYEYSPPPFGLVDWLNSSRCTQLQMTALGSKTAGGGADPTAPTKELSSLLTDLKIYLRGIEYDRQRADDAFLAERGVLAEVNVVPLPGDAGAAGQVMGMLSAPAHSVHIELRPLSAEGQGAKVLADKAREVVERIRRRKLVAALRLTFVEPEVERRLDMSIEAVRRREELQQKATESSTTAAAGDTAPTAKRRIDQAKRYLF